MKKIALLFMLTLINISIFGMETKEPSDSSSKSSENSRELIFESLPKQVEEPSESIINFLRESCAYATNYTTNYLSYYLPDLFIQPPKEYYNIEALRKEINYFERKISIFSLKNKADIIDRDFFDYYKLQKMRISSSFEEEKNFVNNYIINSPYDTERFLLYCYYQKFHNNENEEELKIKKFVKKVKERPNFIKSCLYFNEALYDYSPIGAAIIARDVSIESKRNFIQKLLDHGIKPTEKDIMLAELELYNAIPADTKEKIMLFFNQNKLPDDVKNMIINCMLQSYRKDFWPLPEIADSTK